jgi:acyl carrier protein
MAELKYELKKMIIEECDKECTPEDIGDDEVLFGSDSNLELDSLDALQISLALNKNYNLNITDSKILRKIMTSINTLAEYVEKNR